MQELIASQISTEMAPITLAIAPPIHHIEPVAKTIATKTAATSDGSPNQSIQRYISFSASCAGERATTSRGGAGAVYSLDATAVIGSHVLAENAKLRLLQSWYRDDVHEGPAGLRERKKQRTREQIASAALALFSERGYHATTVADVAAAAEVSERTVFGYFATKEDILFADHLALEQDLAEALAANAGREPALDTLRTFVAENVGRFDAQARIRWEIVRHNELLLAHQRMRQAAFGEVIARAIALELGEQIDDLRTQLVTAAIVAAFTATYEHRYRARSQSASRAQATAVIDEAITFLRGGLDAIRAFPKPY